MKQQKPKGKKKREKKEKNTKKTPLNTVFQFERKVLQTN